MELNPIQPIVDATEWLELKIKEGSAIINKDNGEWVLLDQEAARQLRTSFKPKVPLGCCGQSKTGQEVCPTD